MNILLNYRSLKKSQATFLCKIRDLLREQKSSPEIEFYKRLMKVHKAKNYLIFDVGANMGNKSKIFSRLAKKVISFEPSSNLQKFLTDKFEGTNIILFDCALGSSVTTGEFYEVQNNHAYNSLNPKHIETTARKRGVVNDVNVSHSKVKVEIIEKFILLYGIPKYIKIDVEGYELEVIKGLKTPVPIISFEANLPEFLEETIGSIKHLENISSRGYFYNFSNNNNFMLKSFVCQDMAIEFLRNTDQLYLEIYATLI